MFLVRHSLILKEIWASLDALRVAEEGSGAGSTGKKAVDAGRSGLASGRALEFPGVMASTGAGGGVTGMYSLYKCPRGLLVY